MIPKLQKVKGLGNWIELIIDLGMLLLVVFDLAWLVFDALFTVESFQGILLQIVPNYEEIHKNFLKYDGLIVTIFLIELGFRWLLSIIRKEYRKWFFYPFIHWYDVLGCIPTGSFRVLRLFRGYAMLYRLHKWGVIDLNNYYFYRVLMHYYNIAVEEVADRVVIKVLKQAKSEIQAGESITDAIIEKVIKPKNSEISNWLVEHIQLGLNKKYPEYQSRIKDYVEEVVTLAVKDNKEVSRLEKIPVVGDYIHDTLNKAISNIVFGVIDRLACDFANPEKEAALQVLIETLLEILTEKTESDTQNLPTELVSKSIDLIIKRVQIKKWQEQEDDLGND